MAQTIRDRGPAFTLALCFLASVVEGVDNLSMGLAAPRLAPELGLLPAQVGLALSASLVGLMVGSLIGGRLADHVGRKAVLLGSIIALGVFSLATTLASDLPVLVLVRFLVGLGLGGAFPMLIAFGAEATPKRFRATGISLIYCGQPIGGALISLTVGLGGAELGWRTIFLIGGIAPLVVAALLWRFLPEPASYRAARAASPDAGPDAIGAALFGQRTAITALLWASFLFTMFVVYLMISWIPSLMVAKGLSRSEGAIVTMVLNLGSAVGTVAFGAATDRGHRRATVLAAYAALAISLAGLAYLQGFPMMLLFGTLTGFFMLGCQLVLYTLSAESYPILDRGTGVGAAVAFGRVGAISAPLVAGTVLGAGYGAPAVLAAAIPCVAIAAATALALLLRSRPDISAGG